MAAPPDFAIIFERLRAILREHEPRLVKVTDEPDSYSLDTAHILPGGRPLFFGAVRIGKRYVSYHLMPVYVFPELLDDVPADLRGRMQGKSCFNFRGVEPHRLEELAGLTRRGFERYREQGYVA